MKTVLNPDLYHGIKKEKNFFEGWYFKIVDKDNLNKFAFIPGISLGKSIDEHHSFIQVLDGLNIKYNYLRFNKDDFKFNNSKDFDINVNANNFSLNHISLNLEYDNHHIRGNLAFKNIIKWKDSFINPGSMGFYNYLNFMECYSQVCTVNGDIIGKLNINGKLIDFTGGKVYIEKNWGKSFPKSWVWVQSNSFDNKSVSVTCSLATIPFPLKDFKGFLIGVTLGDKFISFTTINNSKLNLKSIGKDIELVVSKQNLRLTLKTHTQKSDFVLCMGPRNGDMVPLVNETLSGKVEMTLENTKTSKIIYKGIGCATGVEYGGDLINVIN